MVISPTGILVVPRPLKSQKIVRFSCGTLINLFRKHYNDVDFAYLYSSPNRPSRSTNRRAINS